MTTLTTARKKRKHIRYVILSDPILAEWKKWTVEPLPTQQRVALARAAMLTDPSAEGEALVRDPKKVSLLRAARHQHTERQRLMTTGERDRYVRSVLASHPVFAEWAKRFNGASESTPASDVIRFPARLA